MHVVTLPHTLDLDFVLRGPGPGGWAWNLQDTEITVRAESRPPQHVEPLALAAVSAWALRLRRSGTRLHLHPSLQTPYTYRTGLLRSIVTDPPWSDDVDASSDFFPLSIVAGERRVEALHHGVLRTLNLTAPDAVRALGSAVSEIARNAEEHSRSEQPASFSAGWFRNQRRVSFGVADTGVGILRCLRAKGVATLDDDDKSAIEKAIQPHVTGAGAPNVPHAPDNHGIGLHTTRLFARDSGGELVIISGAGALIERHPHELRLVDVNRPWPGTIVGVTIKPHQVGAFALHPAASGVAAGSESPWQRAPSDDAVVLQPPVDSARFAGDKAWYRRHRLQVQQALDDGRSVHIDFGGAVYTTQSAIHALLAEPVRTLGPAAVERLSYSGGGQPLRAAVSLVVNYALGDWIQEHPERDGEGDGASRP